MRQSGLRFLASFSLFLLIGFAPNCASADDQENFNVDSDVESLMASQLTKGCPLRPAGSLVDDTKEPYKSGYIAESDVQGLIDCLDGIAAADAEAAKAAQAAKAAPNAAGATPATIAAANKAADETAKAAAKKHADDGRVSIIHILRWADSKHGSVKFQKWYVYDPHPPKGNLYWTSLQDRFQAAKIMGRQSFRLVYINIDYDLKKGHSESFSVDPKTGMEGLTYPVSYSVTIKKAQTQFVKDLISLATILGAYTPAVAPAAAETEVGYFAFYDFDSQYKTSSIAVSVTQPKAAGGGGGSGSNQIGTQTYTNEGPSWIGLSFAVPLTSYKSLSYSQTNGLITTNQINQQNIYAAVDFYIPPVVPTWTAFRYVPHPFFGMPIKKQPLRNTTLGLSMGWRWLEPFGSVVFDVQQQKTSSTTVGNHLVIKGIWGLKISVSDVVAALKNNKSSSNNSSKSTSTN